MKRSYEAPVRALLRDKMVFLGGPRQVGKTSLALQLLGAEQHPGYLNWDDARVPPRLRRGELPAEPMIVLDEIHKYARWRNLVKGFYDTHKSTTKFIVTGSARLDYYRKGGDSLVGRYNFVRMHPFSLREWSANPTDADVQRLLRFGGFPEPLIRANEDHHRLWQRQRLSRVVRDDLRDLEYVRDVSLVEALVDLLPGRVGSPLSVKSLREDLEVDHKTVARWLTILENLFVCFRIPPYGTPRIRAVKKEQKLYLWDWSQVEDPGPRFENMVASQLLKFCHWQEDTRGFRMELRFIRDVDKREIDFVVLRDKKPLFAVECKSGERGIGAANAYFAARLPLPTIYQVHLGERAFNTGNVRVRPFRQFCEELSLP